jgi:hypothetical protein
MTAGESSLETDIAGRLEWLTDKTEVHDFRMDLKKKERILEALLQKVERAGFVEAA